MGVIGREIELGRVQRVVYTPVYLHPALPPTRRVLNIGALRMKAPTSIILSFLAVGIAACIQPLAMAAPVSLTDESPVAVTKPADDVILIDFGKVAFGNLKLIPPSGANGLLRFHFGEALTGGRIDRKPPGTVRYATTEAQLDGSKEIVVAPPRDERNVKQPAAILTPPEWGVVLPFRWVEIEGWSGELKPANIIRRAAFLTAWDDQAASFESSDPVLNQIWELCRYSIKATTFAGTYVDGDRERIPYEADAYLNQLGHYATDHDSQMARDTFDRLMIHPTWPTEWAPHMVFMAHADWMRNGDIEWLRPRYEALKSKMLTERLGPDGWVHSDKKQQKHDDIVDWPAAERDGFVFCETNTVVNAFHLAAVHYMADLARAVGKNDEADRYAASFEKGRSAFNEALYLSGKGAYRDGVGTDHTSSHASLFTLAFGLVPDDKLPAVTEFLVKRGMTCSVYAAQYLLEGLFKNGAGQAAVALITAKGDRSWRHMVDSGTTITWEAWDQKYKPNQDWNHAWGAAPANLLPRFVLGVEPVSPGWELARIFPHPSGLTQAKGKIPTPRGPVSIEWGNHGGSFALKLDLPAGMKALIDVPAASPSSQLLVNDAVATSVRKAERLMFEAPVSGSLKVTVTP